MKKLIKEIENAPEKSGVYIFKNGKKYIYIGKAKNIKNRLKQHLQQVSIDPKEKKIFSQSVSVEWIITKTDYEAYVLENELIKQYKPKYNVRLKSGSSYPMIVITDEEYPTIKISRQYGEFEGAYFGPFIPAKTARAMKDLLHKLFKLRTCEPMPTRSLVCFDYHLGLCSGPCADKVSKKDYRFNAKVAKEFLSGNVKNVIYQLYDKIEYYSQKLMFEKASIVKDQILAIENVIRKQEVLGFEIKEADIFFFTDDSVFLAIVRGHRIVGKEILKIEEGFSDNLELSILTDYYSRGNLIPENIYLNRDLKDIQIFKKWLKEAKKSKVEVFFKIPEEIHGFILRNLPETNISTQLKESFENIFHFQLPSRIEGFDISTLQGMFTVGSCVVWENGKMNKKEYRRFKVKTVEGVDDYASLREVLFRRFRRYKEMDNPPKLVLIDGGKGQLKQGLIVKDALGLDNLRIFSLAKKEEILYTDDDRQIHLFDYQPLLKLFTKIRDEAHRFAISYNRKLREKEALKDILSQIKGIGKKRKEILYRTYKTVENIASAPEEELVKLGIPRTIAQNIKKYINST
ncbi:MAG: excinuclease ABC subunit UvrC [Aquificae bacterium]|nr:excinuclease ABC subunit UvrC [Aquificota bacterium]